jgi:hypothetical protein
MEVFQVAFYRISKTPANQMMVVILKLVSTNSINEHLKRITKITKICSPENYI